MIPKERPADFKPAFDAVGCLIITADRALFLHRADEKPQGNTWSIPGGKIEPGETKEEATIREVKEETAIELFPKQPTFVKSYAVRYPDVDFNYHLFVALDVGMPTIKIKPDEHKDFGWFNNEEILSKTLIEDGDTCLADTLDFISSFPGEN